MSLRELELSQVAGSSVGEGIEHHQEQEDSPSPAAAAAAPPVLSAPDTADRSAPQPSQLSGEGAELQEDQDDPRPPAAAAAAPLASPPDTADRSVPELSQVPGSSTGGRASGGGDMQEVESEISEADMIFVQVRNTLGNRVFNMPNPMAARYVYTVLFAVMTVVAWILRDIELSRFDHYACNGSHDCITANGVLRASMALAIFFLIMFVSTVNTRKRSQFRNFWHCQWWTPKTAIFIIGCAFALYAPSSLLQLYAMVAHVGAWLFLAIQFFSVISLIMWMNEWCRVDSNRDRWAQMTYGLLPLGAAPVVLHLGSFLGLAFMYYWYAPYREPTTFIYISVAMSVVCLMFLISCVHKVSGGYLAPGLMMAYVVLMCWTTIRSEPHMETGNKKTQSTADWQNILSLVIAAVVIITSTYTVGIDSQWMQVNSTPELEDDVPYGYGFFHLVFALGAMYIGMLFAGWNAHRTTEKWTVDFGWASMRVRATSGLVVAICYILMLASQELWNLMLAVTSNSTPSANEARPAGASVVPPLAA